MSTERAPWPRIMLPPSQVLEWLNKQRPADQQGKKAVLTLRWLVFAEIERCAPAPVPTSITHFTPDEPARPS